MGVFATELQNILEELGMTQSEFSEASGIVQSQVSRYVKGTVRPEPGALEKLCSTLESKHRARLAAAHLSDELPESARDLIQIVIATGKVEDDASINYRAKMPKHLREVFDFFEREALQDKQVADWLIGTYRMLKG